MTIAPKKEVPEGVGGDYQLNNTLNYRYAREIPSCARNIGFIIQCCVWTQWFSFIINKISSMNSAANSKLET